MSGVLDATGATFTWAVEGSEWKSIYFTSTARDPRNKLQNCIIEHAKGYNTTLPSMVRVYYTGTGQPTITGCTFRNATATMAISVESSTPQLLNNSFLGFSNCAIYVMGGTTATVTGNQFVNNAAGVHIDYGVATNPTVNGNSYSGSTEADVRISGSIYADPVAWDEAAGTVYRVTETFSIPNGDRLTITDGIIVKLNPDVAINVSGVLEATGVTFSWAVDGSEWGHIFFSSDARDPRNKLQNCIIEHAKGYNTTLPSMVRVYYTGTGQPTISGCTFRNATATMAISVESSSPKILLNSFSGFSSYAIYLTGNGVKPLIAGNLIAGNTRGIGAFRGAAGMYRANRIEGNTDYGFYNGNTGSTQIVTARYNWWGNSSGPTVEATRSVRVTPSPPKSTTSPFSAASPTPIRTACGTSGRWNSSATSPPQPLPATTTRTACWTKTSSSTGPPRRTGTPTGTAWRTALKSKSG